MWPHRDSDWATNLPRAESAFLELARQICARQELILVCSDEALQQRVQQQLEKIGAAMARVRFFCAPSNDTWARDFGPITVIQNGARRLLDFNFNGWGNKFAAEKDDALTRRLWQNNAFGDVACQPIDFVLEGGSIEVDGCGTLLTTTSCLLAPTRNPQFSKKEITEKLQKDLGIQRILWLENSHLAGDDTDGHIDMLVRFCSADTLAHIQCADKKDEHYPIFAALHEELSQLRTAAGKPYKLVPLPIPPAKYGARRQRLPASYANFLIINGAVLLPTYNDPADDFARGQLQSCFPDREIIDVPALSFVEQGGSVHCLTMQIPA